MPWIAFSCCCASTALYMPLPGLPVLHPNFKLYAGKHTSYSPDIVSYTIPDGYDEAGTLHFMFVLARQEQCLRILGWHGLVLQDRNHAPASLAGMWLGDGERVMCM